MGAPPDASVLMVRATPPRPSRLVRLARGDVRALARELAAVTGDIVHVRREVAALRPNEITRDRLPGAVSELGCVLAATQAATDAIMTAGEEILGSGEASFEAYRDGVTAQVMAIFEACSFQDVTGQRITRVVDALGRLEHRLARFAAAIEARDGAGDDPDEAAGRDRRDALLLHGPPREGEGVAQAEVDKLFD